jgi:CheY-like chemotaxis protein
MSHLALQTDLSRKQKNYIEKTHRAAESLLGIINDILDFSKIEAGKLDIESIDFRLEDVFENLANLVGIKAEDQGLELLFDIDPNLPTAVIGDPLRLGQILVNLGNNAVKFTNKGEVVIAVKVLEQDADKVKLHFMVTDTGVGISADEQQKLFQSFSQVDSSVTRKFGGTGLGLAISKQLTKLMDGEIWVESKQGEGSCFQFTVSLGKQKGEVTKRRSVDSSLGTLKILVVDDNNSARMIFTDMLANMGLQVDESSSGEDALTKLENAEGNERYDLVLMDWKMPAMDGIETAGKIQNSTVLTKLPTIIMVTSYGRDDVMQATGSINIEHYLTKPVTPSSLLDAIMGAMGQTVIEESHRNKSDDQAADIAKLQNAHVLLVEDNEMNQELAMELLQNNGIRVDIANNGQEALDWLAKTPIFDGVLMDCQMPVLDGYNATRQIRLQQQFSALPILAMTANAMVGDREKALDAGMNDHISKPINVANMFKVMAKWIKPANPVSSNVMATPSSTLKSTLVKPKIAYVNVDEGLERTQGNLKLYYKLLKKFTESQLDFAESFKAAMTSQDPSDAERCSHTLRVVAGNIGADIVMQEAALLEQACKDSATENEILERLKSVEMSLSSVLTSISAVLQKPEQGVESDISINKDLANGMLQKLIGLLEEDDASAIDIIDELHELPGIQKYSSVLNALTKAIESYDFSLGLELSKEIIFMD